MAKKKKHEEHIDESWLIPYADILTLLLALFIVLFATSTVNEGKYEQMAQALNQVLAGGDNVIEYPSPIPTEGRSDWVVPEDVDNAEEIEEEIMDLEKVQERIDSYIEQNNLSLSLQTELTQKGLLITILDQALFASGSAEVKTEARSLAKEIGILIQSDPPREIQVSGHTDNVPISTANFRSNWDLSAMRAINFMKILLTNASLNPANFSATGYGEYQPKQPNETDNGRQANRRVEVLILPTIPIDVAFKANP